MKETIDWLATVEERAEKFYRNAAECLRDDPKTAEFLRRLATEEAWHRKLMEKASALFTAESSPVPAISLDDLAREKIETAFAWNDALFSSGAADMQKIIERLVFTEFSEWNDAFLYVVNSLKGRNRDFMSAAASIQDHLKRIEKFVEAMPGGETHLHVIKCLPELWRRRFLVVEDNEAVRDFISAILRHEGKVDVAGNGEEGLAKVRQSYYDVIISDVQMPVIDGIEFYRRAVDHDADIGRRFLFMTAAYTASNVSFFEENKLPFLVKPMPVHAIRQRVADILSSVSDHV